MSALYVDPISDTAWNRPAKKITRESAHAFLMDVSREYYLERNHRYGDLSIVTTKDAELAEALKNWADRPRLVIKPRLIAESWSGSRCSGLNILPDGFDAVVEACCSEWRALYISASAHGLLAV
jgi:hypothetical protein